MVSLWGAARLSQQDDVLVFLPQQDPDVRRFAEVSQRFGGLRVALVGVEAPPNQDLFAAANLARIRTATNAIRNLDGVDHVLSLTEVTDPVSTTDGVDLLPLIPDVPGDAGALRQKVLSREHVAGSLVSRDGRAALIMAFFADGARDSVLCQKLRQVAAATLAPLDTYFGGAPFAGRSIYEEAQADIWRLSPVALLVLLLVIVLSYRDLVGVVLTVLSVVLAALTVVGAMGWAREPFTAATSTLPVILFASGSSYAVHVLGRYYLERARVGAREAIGRSLAIVGPPVAIAAATTSVGFFSFVFTDVRPMRAFGIACGAGVLTCWLASLTLVPAVLTLWPRRAVDGLELRLLGAGMVWLWRAAQRRRLWVLAIALVAGAAALRPMRRVQVRMEPHAFFRPGSEPWRAEAFLDERFGGATFVQVALHGDFDDPATLRELERLCQFARALRGVTQVQAITQPLMLIAEAMSGVRQLPETAAQAANLYFFLDGQPGMRALITPARRDALVHVRVRGDAHPVVDALERYVAVELRARPGAPTVRDVAERLDAFARTSGRAVDAATLTPLLAAARLPSDDDPAWRARRGATWLALLGSDESARMPPEAEERVITKTRREFAVARLLPTVMQRLQLPRSAAAEVAPLLDDLFFAGESAAREPLRGEVAGEPVLARGFSRSVAHNLDRSLAISIAVVLALLFLLFRSLRLSIVCMFPSLLTLALLFAALGLLDVRIDLGTSLVAGIATGAGSDFAMHWLWYLKRQSATEVARTVGPIMVVSILLVSLGFFVLALGRSPVMQLLGTLAGLSMALSALLTCLLLPALRPTED
jgi:predicted RND superfamily exporter protein